VVTHACFQATEQFDVETLFYIRSLKMNRDVDILRGLGIGEDCISTYRICCTVLTVGAERGLTLFDLGNILLRYPAKRYNGEVGPLSHTHDIFEGQPVLSTLERLVQLSKHRVSMDRGDQQVNNPNVFGDLEMDTFTTLFIEFVDALLLTREGERSNPTLPGAYLGQGGSSFLSKLEGMPLQRQRVVFSHQNDT
jgi:hypothetical protein